jgi:hypothetical protein
MTIGCEAPNAGRPNRQPWDWCHALLNSMVRLLGDILGSFNRWSLAYL